MSDNKYYKKDLFEDLKDPSYAIGYLLAANQEGEEALQCALKDILIANGTDIFP